MSDRILVVDDDRQITTFLRTYLQKQGFEVLCAASGREMRSILSANVVDLCVLDIGLPDSDGFDLTRELREKSDLPIIVLSVRDESYDRIFGLETGADDYITKPFEPRELVARIRSVLRRTRIEAVAPIMGDGDPSVLRFGRWVLNVAERTVIDRDTGDDAGLTSMEFDLLRVFAAHPRVVLTRDQLMEMSRGNNAVVGDRAIDVHVMRLRKKIEPDEDGPVLIKTVHGVGYCFASEVSRAERVL
ncbi:MAG: response regulator transcription factor [Pseudomonadota bacterium]